MRWLAPLASLVLLACAGGRTAPEGLETPRADPLLRVRVERLLDGGRATVALDRLSGAFRVARAGAVLDLPYRAALVLDGAGTERIRVLFDHHPQEAVPIPVGADVVVRYAHHGVDVGRRTTLTVRDDAGVLLFAAVVRPPGAAPSAEEERLAPSLRPDPTDERVYREFLRQESYCTTERDHYAARLRDGAGWRRVAPGERVAVTFGGRSWRVHLVDVSRVARTDCAERPPDWLAYQVVAVTD